MACVGEKHKVTLVRVPSDASVEQAYIRCENNQWLKNRLFDIADYVNYAWDEGVNCSRYRNPNMERKVATRLSKLSAKRGENYNCPMMPEQCSAMIARYADGVVPRPGNFSAEDNALLASADQLLARCRHEMDQQAIHLMLTAIWQVVADANRYFASQEPWALRKSNPQRMGTVLYVAAEVVRQIAFVGSAIASVITGLTAAAVLRGGTPVQGVLFIHAASGFSIGYSVDALAAWFLLVLSVLAGPIAIFSIGYARHAPPAKARRKNHGSEKESQEEISQKSRKKNGEKSSEKSRKKNPQKDGEKDGEKDGPKKGGHDGGRSTRGRADDRPGAVTADDPPRDAADSRSGTGRLPHERNRLLAHRAAAAARHEIEFFGQVFAYGPAIDWHTDPVSRTPWPRP